MSLMRFSPTGRGHEDDEDGQEGCSTTANASLIGQTGDWLALQDLTMMLPSRLGCPMSLKTPNMGNPGQYPFIVRVAATYCSQIPAALTASRAWIADSSALL